VIKIPRKQLITFVWLCASFSIAFGVGESISQRERDFAKILFFLFTSFVWLFVSVFWCGEKHTSVRKKFWKNIFFFVHITFVWLFQYFCVWESISQLERDFTKIHCFVHIFCLIVCFSILVWGKSMPQLVGDVARFPFFFTEL
jgi:FtsH-binding integral membrane protein